jgi:molecular chaperone GrpE (heat shock protein)
MLAKYLKDFSSPEPAMPVERDILPSLSGNAFPELDFSLPETLTIDLDAERASARDEGYQKARQDFQAEQSEILDRIQRQNEADLEELHARHENETVTVIHQRFREMADAISQNVSEQVLRVILPLVERRFADKAVKDLAELVRKTLSDTKATTAIVKGPESLYLKLKGLLDKEGVDVRHVPAENIDLSVEINDTILMTRLAGWSRSLSEVME